MSKIIIGTIGLVLLIFSFIQDQRLKKIKRGYHKKKRTNNYITIIGLILVIISLYS